MITPKEKAEYLVGKFYDNMPDNDLLIVEVRHLFDTLEPLAKKCALICVNEIIEENMLLDKDNIIEFDSLCKLVERNNYWQEVKQEIEKL